MADEGVAEVLVYVDGFVGEVEKFLFLEITNVAVKALFCVLYG